MSRREAKIILKAYGKARFDSHVAYTERFDEDQKKVSRKVGKYAVKRWCSALVCIAVIMSAGLISAEGLGIKLFNFNKQINTDHDFFTFESSDNVDNTKTKRDLEYHLFTYIPEDFEEKSHGKTISGIVEYCYESRTGKQNLIIKEGAADAVTIAIDNERCESRTVIAGDVEVMIYDFYSEEAPDIYLAQMDDMIIYISTDVGMEEVKNIISGIQ